MVQEVRVTSKEFAFGTLISVSGGCNGTLKVVARGGAIKGKKIDVWMGDKNHHQDFPVFGKETSCTFETCHYLDLLIELRFNVSSISKRQPHFIFIKNLTS